MNELVFQDEFNTDGSPNSNFGTLILVPEQMVGETMSYNIIQVDQKMFKL